MKAYLGTEEVSRENSPGGCGRKTPKINEKNGKNDLHFLSMFTRSLCFFALP